MGIQIGLLNVRRSILIRAPAAHVWEEFASLERIGVWLGIGHELHESSSMGGCSSLIRTKR